MTPLLEHAFELAKTLPSDEQDEVAHLILAFAGVEGDAVDLTADDEAEVLLSREAARRGEFASEEQMRALWAKYGL